MLQVEDENNKKDNIAIETKKEEYIVSDTDEVCMKTEDEITFGEYVCEDNNTITDDTFETEYLDDDYIEEEIVDDGNLSSTEKYEVPLANRTTVFEESCLDKDGYAYNRKVIHNKL